MMALLEKIDQMGMNQRLLVMVIILALIGVGFYFYVYKKLDTQIVGLSAQDTSLQSDLQSLRVVAAKLPEFQSKIDQLQRQLTEIRKQLPQEKEIPDLLANISRASTESGLTTELFRPGGETPKSYYVEQSVNLTVTGPFHNIAMFLDRVAHFPRIINITNLAMSGPKETAGYTFVTGTLQATTYRYAEKN